jgi:hypothetical protein
LVLYEIEKEATIKHVVPILPLLPLTFAAGLLLAEMFGFHIILIIKQIGKSVNHLSYQRAGLCMVLL